MKKILLLSTGGTIASAQGPEKEGLVSKFTGEDMLKLIPELYGIFDIDCKVILNLDSSNIQPEDWKLIAHETFKGLESYDGIVITHGTDTMAYSSSMLSFMLKNLNKPVILTGSQLPIDAPHTDGRRNMLHAFMVAGHGLPGVYIVFDGKIISGVRAVKMRTASFDAFESVNVPPVGYVHGRKVVIQNHVRNTFDGPIQLDDSFDSNVFLLKLVPGTRPEILDSLKALRYSGIVIESFGTGGLPFMGRNLIPKVIQLLETGIPVVVTTQCVFDGANLSVYEVGLKTLKAGAIPAYDMTTETAVTKLMWVLGHTRDLGSVKKMMLENYCGEINIS